MRGPVAGILQTLHREPVRSVGPCVTGQSWGRMTACGLGKVAFTCQHSISSVPHRYHQMEHVV